MSGLGFWSMCATRFLREVVLTRMVEVTDYPSGGEFEETDELGVIITEDGERMNVGTVEVPEVAVRRVSWKDGRMQERLQTVRWLESRLPQVGEQVAVYEVEAGRPACFPRNRVEVWFRSPPHKSGSRKPSSDQRTDKYRVVEVDNG